MPDLSPADHSAAIQAIASVLRDEGPITRRSADIVLRAKLDADERYRLATFLIQCLDIEDMLYLTDAMSSAAAQTRLKRARRGHLEAAA